MGLLQVLGHMLMLASLALGQLRGLPAGSVLTVRRGGPNQPQAAPLGPGPNGGPQNILVTEGLVAGAPPRQQRLSLLSEYMAPSGYSQQAPLSVPSAPAAQAQRNTAPFAQAQGSNVVGPGAYKQGSPPAVTNNYDAQVWLTASVEPPAPAGSASQATTQQSAMVGYLFDPLPNEIVNAANAKQANNNNMFQQPQATPSGSNFPPNNLGVPEHIYQILAQQATAEQPANQSPATPPIVQEYQIFFSPTSQQNVPAQPVNQQPLPLPAQQLIQQQQQQQPTAQQLVQQLAASQALGISPTSQQPLGPQQFAQPIVSQPTWSSPASRAVLSVAGTQIPVYTPLGSIGQGQAPPSAPAGSANVGSALATLVPGIQLQGPAQQQTVLSQLLNPAAANQVSPWLNQQALLSPAPGNPLAPNSQAVAARHAFYPSNNRHRQANVNNQRPLAAQMDHDPVPIVTVPPIWFNFHSFTDIPDHLKKDDPHKKNKEEEKGA